jgi:hypothetical protein
MGIEMMHPIYTHEEYLTRMHRKYVIPGQGDWPNLIARLDSEDAAVVPAHLKTAPASISSGMPIGEGSGTVAVQVDA